MPAITLRPATWNELVALAKRQQQKPDRLVERAVRDFLTRTADEELLAKSRRAALGNGKTRREIEEAIKQRRRAKR
jgi:predicted transcriptional regulator